MDTLEIIGLRVATRIGVHEWEQRIKQRLLIDINLQLDCRDVNENLANTIDYNTLCQAVTEFVESNSFKLIETVAERIVALIQNDFQITLPVTVRVSKPDAIKNAANVSIVIKR